MYPLTTPSSDRFDMQHDSARIGDESIGVHEGSRQCVRSCSRRLILLRISGPQNAKLIARAHRPEARREYLLIEVEVEATLPRSQPKVEREENGWHLAPVSNSTS